MGTHSRRKGKTFWGTVEEKRAEKKARQAAKQSQNTMGAQPESKATPQPLNEKTREQPPVVAQYSRLLCCR